MFLKSPIRTGALQLARAELFFGLVERSSRSYPLGRTYGSFWAIYFPFAGRLSSLTLAAFRFLRQLRMCAKRLSLGDRGS